MVADIRFSKRQMLKKTAMVNISATLSTGASPPARAQLETISGEWPQFGYNVANTAYNPDTTAPDNAQLLWSFKRDSGFRSSPAVVKDTVFIGGADNSFYAIDALTGSTRWTFETEARNVSSPAVVNKTVFFGSHDNNLYALDAATGQRQWSFATDDFLYSSPTVTDGTVYIGGNDNNLYAVDASTGRQQWAYDTGGRVWASPAVANETVFVGDLDTDSLHAIDTATGNKKWDHTVSGPLRSSPAVAHGSVFIGTAGPGLARDSKNLFAVDADTGDLEWALETDQKLIASPSVAGGTVYVPSGGGYLYAVDAISGEQEWTFELESGGGVQPTIADETVLVGGNGNYLHAIDAATGNEQWQFETGSDVDNSPAVVDSIVFFGGRDGNLYALGDPTQVPSTTTTAATGTNSAEGGSRGDSVLNDAALLGTSAVGLGVLALFWRARSRIGWSSNNNSSIPDSLHYDPSKHGRPPDKIPGIAAFDIIYNEMHRDATIGHGGDADVYRASVIHDDTEIDIALKQPRFEGTLHTETVERFEREAETWSKLDSNDHIVDIIDWGTEPLPWIAMEYLDAGDLAARSGELSFPQAVWTAGRITEAVRHAHAHGVVHLDLKPANILLRNMGDDYWDIPKVGDWGLAKLLLNHSTSVEGLSPEYAAPEQFDPNEFGGTDERTDIYQLGSIFYELFTGEPAYEGSATAVLQSKLMGDVTLPSAVNSSLPTDIDDILIKAMAIEKQDRYSSVIEFRDDLQALFSED
jgi:outer membrane protein assembly factor BamB/tRNA A-37 threonylcarbamoyl transferase component Bud32